MSDYWLARQSGGFTIRHCREMTPRRIERLTLRERRNLRDDEMRRWLYRFVITRPSAKCRGDALIRKAASSSSDIYMRSGV